MGARGRVRRYDCHGYDPGRAGYGSGPQGGPYNAGLIVPKFVPTPTPTRFLLRLASAQIAPNELARLVRYRLRSTITQVQRLAVPLSSDYPIEREVVSEFWSFIDGNILYFFYKEPIQSSVQSSPDTTAGPSTQKGFDGNDSALLYAQYDPATNLYVPPNGGNPTGQEIGGRSSMLDTGGEWVDLIPFDSIVKGPCRVVLYASVLQTNPLTRPMLPAAQQPSAAYAQGLRPEDQFLFGWGDTSATNNVQYHRVFGSFEVEHDLEPDPTLPC